MNTTVEVWSKNMVQHFKSISKIAATHYGHYICLDTEFPGFMHRTPRAATPEQRYNDMKLNVDATKIIQLGFTFFNPKGESLGYSWQINFKNFNPSVDPHATNSIQLLKESGIDFERNLRDGVDAALLSKFLWSDLISHRRGRTKWITFHGLYDLAYVVKLLVQAPLPNTLPEFLHLVRDLLGQYVYDVKYMAKFCSFDESVGLVMMAKRLGVEIRGQNHQAGHDSMLVGNVFWKIKEKFGIDEDNFAGIFHGVEKYSLAAINSVPYYHPFMAPSIYFAPQVSYAPCFFYW